MTIQADSSQSAAPAAGSTAPAAGASPPADAPSSGGGSDLESIFRFDPFAPEEKPAAPQAPEATPAPQETQPPAAPSAAPQAPAAPQAQTPAVPQEIQAKLDEIARAVQPQQPQQPQVDPVEQVNLPDYGVTVPPALMQLLSSQNPQEMQQGVQHLVKGVAEMTHRNVVIAMRRELQAALPQIIQNQVVMHTETQRIHQDFYGKYPQLNNPALYATIQQLGLQTARELGIQGWTDALRDEIGRRAMSLFSGLAPQQAPRPAPVAITPSGARPAPNAAPPAGSQERHIQELFG